MESKIPEHQNQQANRQQYAALSPALEAWRSRIMGRVASMEGCKHTFAKSGTIFVCQKCSMASPVVSTADEIEYW